MIPLMYLLYHGKMNRGGGKSNKKGTEVIKNSNLKQYWWFNMLLYRMQK